MPTRTSESNPFAPRGQLTREQLRAYAEGTLTPEQEHWVELHREADPLIDEAISGFAAAGHGTWDALDKARPGGAGGVNRWLIAGGVFVIAAASLVIAGMDNDSDEATVAAGEASGTVAPAPPMTITAQEIDEATEQPESLLVGHEEGALHTRARVQERFERERIERLEPRRARVQAPAVDAGPRDTRHARRSVQLAFLHDLKVVHPSELYATDPVMRLSDAGVPARFADEAAQDRASEEMRTMAYLEFLDVALGRFALSDHKACLEDLRFLLSQYPDDVNALFYAGLCAYDLGLYERARLLLHRAATHSVGIFDEEANWYHALTLERLGEQQAAEEAFGRIAGQGGFYANQARARLK